MTEIDLKPIGNCKNADQILIFGTGDFSQALGWRLSKAGCAVTLVSRNPETARKKLVENFADVITVQEALSLPKSVIILAIPESVDTKELYPLLKGQVVLDVRNRIKMRKSQKDYSLAQTLQDTHPDAFVVKALNTFSAYALRSGIYQSGNQTPICGNNSIAKDKASKVLRNLGLTPVDVGDVSQAIELEKRPHAFFDEWTTALVITGVVMSISWLILVFKIAICPNLDSGGAWDWNPFKKIILNIAELTFGMTALTDLAFCYTPGIIAAYLQLYRETKYSLFPNWLDTWLKCRKQLGLIAAQLALTHWIGALIVGLPYLTGDSFWRYDAYFITGIFGYCLMFILCAVSLPSVAGTLSWREFSFLQRYFGWWSLIFSTLHLIFLGWDELFKNNFTCVFIPSSAQVVMVIPFLTIFFKLPLLFPPVDHKLKRIRRGVDAKRTKTTTTANYNLEAGISNGGFTSD